MFPSKTHYKLRECFELLGLRLFGDDVWTGTEASAKYPDMLDRTIRTLSSYLARPKLEGNVVDFAAHKTNPKMNELAPETKSLDKLVRYGKLAHEREMGLVDVFKEHDPDYRTAIQRQARQDRAAASGDGASDPTVDKLHADLTSEGEYRALEGAAGEEPVGRFLRKLVLRYLARRRR